MKHFRVYRKLILVADAVTAAVSIGAVVFTEGASALMLFVIFAFAFLCGSLFLLDFLHRRYNDDLLEQTTLLIEALAEQEERIIFPENEDTLAARLQHQVLKLRNILKAPNQLMAQEKAHLQKLIYELSHQIKTTTSAATPFAQFLDGKEFSDDDHGYYNPTLLRSLEQWPCL